MADHAPRFLKIVEDSRQRVREIDIDQLRQMREADQPHQLVDVREESEFANAHIPGAQHLGKGVIERDIEHAIPDVDAPIVLYCGGGYRSALAADNLQKMGYTHVISLAGGFRAWKDANLPTES